MQEMKVLIVDDNSYVRQMMKNYLVGIADETFECEDGADALDAYKNFQPDWVLMDWEMKRMDGLAATRGIFAGNPDAKIVMVTQYDDSELREAASEAGVSGFVLKDDLLSLRSILK
jgi:CheY-like chemotaxis protein